MDIQTLTSPDFIYTIQSKFFNLEREYFDKVIYAFLAIYKILFGFFNLVPYIALKLIT